jgi:hypothetical protein
MNSSGVISGTPTGIATDTFTVQVSSGGQTASQLLTLTVSSAGVVKITTLLMASGHVGQLYSMQLLASGGGVYVWALASGSLPAGLSLSASGLITGIPTTVQTPTFQVTVSSIGQVDSKSLTVSISP